LLRSHVGRCAEHAAGTGDPLSGPGDANPRGTAPTSFPAGQKSFVGGTTDTSTNLTNLGIREYQAITESFISPDPVLQPYNPQDLDPYAYSQDAPSTLSDPTGAAASNHCATGHECGGDTSGLIEIAPGIYVSADDPYLAALEKAWLWAIETYNGASVSYLWTQICNGPGKSACDGSGLERYFEGSAGTDYETAADLQRGQWIYVGGGAIGAIMLPAGLSTAGDLAYIRSWQIYTSPKFDEIEQAYKDGKEVTEDIDGTEVMYKPDFEQEAISFHGDPPLIVLGPKSMVSEQETVISILWESFRLENQDGQGESVDTTRGVTDEAQEFAEGNAGNLIAETWGMPFPFGSDGDPEPEELGEQI
jgi:RHS repeat-associated protein